MIEGEVGIFTGDGFTADFDPGLTADQFQTQLMQMGDVFYNDAARGLLISFTAYS